MTVHPDVIPPDLGNALLAVRAAGDVALSWTAAPEARTYPVYRSDTKGVWLATLVTGLPAPSIRLPDVPGAADLGRART